MTVTQNQQRDPEMQATLWRTLTDQAETLATTSPALGPYIRSSVLQREGFADCLAHVLGSALVHAAPPEVDLAPELLKLYAHNPGVVDAAAEDLVKLDAVNPACPDLLTGLLSFRGFQALQVYRLAHAMWQSGEKQFGALVQNWGALKYAIDIHPGARIGRRVFIDHGIGLVVGETSVIEDDVNIWHGVTLGSTLTESGDRHPKIRRGATICAGATILGNIEVGEFALVAADTVVLKNVPARTVVVGVPGRLAGPVPGRLDAIDEAVKRLATTA
ncbi:serine O-acetyltransferase EpsC [Variovorax ureilyticus]|uniref:Serine acetyltransferase n=1 Tax=Variovorax ureilyticus TaxID=1836198 RepID=A0ABU8VKZ4_9BURK